MAALGLSPSDLVSAIHFVHQLCQDIETAKKSVTAAGEKLMSLIPILQTLENNKAHYNAGSNKNEYQSLLGTLSRDLKALEKVILKAKKMNKILYVIKASSIHEDIDTFLKHMHFSLAALSVWQNDSIRDSVQAFQAEWRKRDHALAEEQKRENAQKDRLLQGNVTSNLLKVTGGSLIELKVAQQAIQDERLALLKECEKTADSVRQSKAKIEEDAMKQIIAALELAEVQQQQGDNLPQPVQEASTENGPPEWAICPITRGIMKDPVRGDSEGCECACSRGALQQWLDKGKMTCPVCGLELKSARIRPLPRLRSAIEASHFAEEPIDLELPAEGNVPEPPQIFEEHKQSKTALSGKDKVTKATDTALPITVAAEDPSKIRDVESGTPVPEEKKDGSNRNFRLSCYAAIGLVIVVLVGIIAGVMVATSEQSSTPTSSPSSSVSSGPTSVATSQQSSAATSSPSSSVTSGPTTTSGTTMSEQNGLASIEAFGWTFGLDTTEIDLEANGFKGSIPSELGKLTALTRLALSHNALTGTIPTQLGRLTEADYINLRWNDLNGPIPSELGQLTAVTTLHLRENDLTGTVPAEVGQLKKLVSLTLNGNNLVGSIPSSICALPLLDIIYLDCNSEIEFSPLRCDCGSICKCLS